MAAEIAGALAVGACCPVCGSADHPQKARAAADAPDAVAEKEALRLLDDAKSEEQARDGLVRDLTTRLGLAREHADGAEPEALRRRLAEIRGDRDALAARVGRAPALTRQLETAEAQRDRLAAECAALDLEVGTLDEAVRGRAADRAALQAELDVVLAGARDLRTRLAAHQARVDVGRAALQTLEEAATASRTALEAEAGLRTAAEEAGFADVAGAADALLDPAALAALERRVAAHQQRLAAVTAVLGEPGAAADAAAAPPDLPALEQQHGEALSHLGAARSRSTLWGSRAERLAVLVDQLAAVLEEWRPLRESLELATRLAAFVDGRSADNSLQMRLSAYVLAYRLSQVVAAANQRLCRMSDQRYSLEHTGRRAAGETRGGLSLAVRDAWSGQSRDPATLSGGETFVVSLALALGLADVITQESDAGDGGDSRLDTLFVDEGFGTLDADTLDDVMDVLDSLRDGGRVVGVVSHVAEMRDRIPAQLRVVKTRRGSTVAVSP
jgi:exonuclease SbcC